MALMPLRPVIGASRPILARILVMTATAEIGLTGWATGRGALLSQRAPPGGAGGSGVVPPAGISGPLGGLPPEQGTIALEPRLATANDDDHPAV